MGKLSLELNVARKLYERRLRTLRRINHHVKSMPSSAEARSSAEVALKIAKAELRSAKHQLERVFDKVQRQSRSTSRQPSTIPATPERIERDLFSEALNRTDPAQRLRLIE